MKLNLFFGMMLLGINLASAAGLEAENKKKSYSEMSLQMASRSPLTDVTNTHANTPRPLTAPMPTPSYVAPSKKPRPTSAPIFIPGLPRQVRVQSVLGPGTASINDLSSGISAMIYDSETAGSSLGISPGMPKDLTENLSGHLTETPPRTFRVLTDRRRVIKPGSWENSESKTVYDMDIDDK